MFAITHRGLILSCSTIHGLSKDRNIPCQAKVKWILLLQIFLFYIQNYYCKFLSKPDTRVQERHEHMEQVQQRIKDDLRDKSIWNTRRDWEYWYHSAREGEGSGGISSMCLKYLMGWWRKKDDRIRIVSSENIGVKVQKSSTGSSIWVHPKTFPTGRMIACRYWNTEFLNLHPCRYTKLSEHVHEQSALILFWAMGLDSTTCRVLSQPQLFSVSVTRTCRRLREVIGDREMDLHKF